MNEMETPQVEKAPLAPQPIPKHTMWAKLLGGVGVAALAGGTLLFLAVGSAGRARGSTVSYHLKWEERDRIVQSEVQRAMDAAATKTPVEAQPADRDPCVDPNGSE